VDNREETKKTLVTLAANMGTILAEIAEAGGELSPKIEALLDDVGKDLALKTDSYVMVMDKLEAESEFWKSKADSFSRVSKGCAHVVQQMKERIKMAILLMGEDEVRGADFRFKLSPSQPRLTINEHELPEEWLMVVTANVPDKERIRAALEAGQEIPGATYEQTKSLRKYVNKKGS
jgi:hypothetical protein